MGPVYQSMTLVAGDDEVVEFILTSDGEQPLDITSRSYYMQVRNDPSLAGPPECTFTCTVPIGTDGRVVCVANDTQTQNLVPGREYHWSLLEVVSGMETTLITGEVEVERQVSKN